MNSIFRWMLFSILGIASVTSAVAQSIPLESMLGQQNYLYQHTFARKLGDSGPFGIFHTASVYAFYQERAKNEVMNQSYLTYRLSSFTQLALGTFYASAPGFSPSASVQFFFKSNNLSFAISPRADIRKNGSFDGMILLDFRPEINHGFYWIVRFQTMSSWGHRGHNRSYQNFRIGMGKQQTQAGLALNIDEYGSRIITNYNWGMFVRYELN